MKIDFKKTVATYKARRGRFDLVDVPAMHYLMVDGHGGPASRGFATAIEALYPVAYTLKFMSKIDLERDYVVPPLEALWWAEDWAVFTTKFDKSKWDWTVMLMLPEWIDAAMFKAAIEKVRHKSDPPGLDRVRRELYDEGRCVQTLHLGPYSDEGPVLREMHEVFVPAESLALRGKHHEIYFNDFRKTAPEKLRTILRQPVAKQETT